VFQSIELRNFVSASSTGCESNLRKWDILLEKSSWFKALKILWRSLGDSQQNRPKADKPDAPRKVCFGGISRHRLSVSGCLPPTQGRR
jgi:hypothetical protein